MNARRAWGIAFGAMTFLICVLTLLPSGGWRLQPPELCVLCERRDLADGILNFALFLPFGFTAARATRSALRGAVLGVLFSMAIEVAQIFIPGRDPALADIIFNGAGAIAGALISRYVLFRRLFNGSGSSRAALVSLSLAAVSMMATAVLLQPVARWNPRSDSFKLTWSARSEGASEVSRSVSGSEVLFIGRRSDDLVLRYRSRADLMRLDEPEYWLGGLFTRAGLPSPITVARSRGRWCVTYDSVADCTIGPSLGRGWAMLGYPDAIGRRLGREIDALWIALLFIPIGFWITRRTLLPVAAISVALMWLLPAIAGIVPTRPMEWLGAVTGLVGGMGLRTLARIVRTRIAERRLRLRPA